MRAGFYALKGKDTLHFLERSRGRDISELLRKIREANAGYRVIVVLLDNFASHRSQAVRAEAQRLGIRLVYLPPYSLDFIEPIWRAIKRVVSTASVKGANQMRSLIQTHFQRLVQKLSFCWALITHFPRLERALFQLVRQDTINKSLIS